MRHEPGADPGAVVFDAVRSAKARNADVLIIDTAGRLHTKANLMEELRKVKRIIQKQLPGAPDETLLVLDATTGQNGLQQAKVFTEVAEVSDVRSQSWTARPRSGSCSLSLASLTTDPASSAPARR